MSMLIVNASPRESGNSSFIADNLMEKYRGECEVINLKDLEMKPCVACRMCKQNNSLCVIDDDISKLYPKLLSSSKIIFISPNIMGFISSLAKILTDRFYCLKTTDSKSRFLENAKLFFILTQGASDRKHGDMATNWAKNFFEHYNLKTYTMVIPNCSYNNNDGVNIKLNEIMMNISMF